MRVVGGQLLVDTLCFLSSVPPFRPTVSCRLLIPSYFPFDFLTWFGISVVLFC